MTHELRTILVPTDFSDLSIEALSYASFLAGTFGSTLIVLHVIDDAPALAMHTMELATDVFIEDTNPSAERQLEQLVRTLDPPPATGARTIVRRGNPHEEITRCAEDEHADLIVMATHGRTGLAHALLGSVAEKVVQHASVPVLTVKPPGMTTARTPDELSTPRSA